MEAPLTSPQRVPSPGCWVRSTGSRPSRLGGQEGHSGALYSAWVSQGLRTYQRFHTVEKQHFSKERICLTMTPPLPLT